MAEQLSPIIVSIVVIIIVIIVMVILMLICMCVIFIIVLIIYVGGTRVLVTRRGCQIPCNWSYMLSG